MTPPPRARALWPAAYSSQAQRTARRGDNKALTSKQCKYPHYQPLTPSNILAAVSNTIYHVSPETLTAFTMLAVIAPCSQPYRPVRASSPSAKLWKTKLEEQESYFEPAIPPTAVGSR